MSKEDNITINVLDDGSVQVITDGVSSVNHTSADNLVAMIAKLAGGETNVKKRKEGHTHSHSHSHSHASAGGHKH